MLGYRALVDVSSLAGAEERKLRAARRFGRIGLLITLAWMLLVPAYVLVFDALVIGLDPVALTPVLLLYAVAVGLHLWRIRQHTRSLGAVAPTWFVLAASATGLALSLLGLAIGFTGFMWALVTGVLLGDIVAGMRARRTAVWILCATVAVLGPGYLVVVARGETFVEMVWVLAGCAAFFVATMWMLDV